MPLNSDLPSVRATVRLGGRGTHEVKIWYDVKFYPYIPPGGDPVFAVTGGYYTIICRCDRTKENSMEILRAFKDEDIAENDPDGAGLNSLEWSRAANGDPLVCVAGGPTQIKVLNVKTGELVQTLSGHGDNINDLKVSPVDPTIMASASLDHSVRIWSLDPTHKKQPTAAICFGEGHKENVLCLGFHSTGQYLLSGGMDTRLNLWMVPKTLKETVGTDKPALLHYPHFSSTEIHTDVIDCVSFHNDLILSKAAKENIILLWRIDNFSSQRDPPNSAPMPPSQTIHSKTPVYVPASSVSGTRSAWGGGFQRLLQFELKKADIFYIRFNLFHDYGKHPILAVGNQEERLFFWDLKRLEEAGVAEDSSTHYGYKAKNNAPFLAGPSKLPSTLASKHREGSTTSNASSAAQSNGSGTASSTAKAKPTKNKDIIGDPFYEIPAHKNIQIPLTKSQAHFVVRQVTWSPGGEWCVAVGDLGMITILSRWEDGIPKLDNNSNIR